MTELLYQTDSYLKEFERSLLRSTRTRKRSRLTDGLLSWRRRSAQRCSMLAGLNVLKVRKAGDDVLHISGWRFTAVGTRVHG